MGVFSAPIPAAKAKFSSYLDVVRHVDSGPSHPWLHKLSRFDAILKIVKRDAHPPKGVHSNSCDGRTDPCTPAPYREYTGTTKSKRIISARQHTQSGMLARYPIGAGRSVSADEVESTQDASLFLAPLVNQQQAHHQHGAAVEEEEGEKEERSRS